MQTSYVTIGSGDGANAPDSVKMLQNNVTP